jgi:DNA-directed RNA polymerase specialized sigma24 family protein/limonene-1,2-epoxide hydrolase
MAGPILPRPAVSTGAHTPHAAHPAGGTVGRDMRDPDEFDEFYKSARHRVLLQTYALTADLAASRSAVRDAFVAAWHHWRKVSRLDDPEDWVRPHAWHVAQRRHTARLGRRDKSLRSEEEATFDALGELTAHQRHALVLAELSDASCSRIAREVGVPDEAFERDLALARATFPIHRGIEPAETTAALRALSARTEEVRFPRASIIRRAGTARRRAHTTLGVAGALVALGAASLVVGQPEGADPGLDSMNATGPQASEEASAPPIDVDSLLTSAQVGRALGRRAAEPRTDDNTAGDGKHTTCQQSRYADPAGVAGLVRHMRVQGRGTTAVRQAVDLSDGVVAAEQAYDTAVGWYAACTAARVQLLSTYDVRGVGDEATVLVLRRWSDPVTTYAIGVARTGALVTQVIHETTDRRQTRVPAETALLGQAVAGLCVHEDAGGCTGKPRAVPSAPPASGQAPGFLQVVDLPPVSGVSRPWSASSVLEADPNPARTICDEASFTGKPIRWSGSRTFLIRGAKLPTSFGLSETVGRFASAKAARGQLRMLHGRMDRCEDDDLSAKMRVIKDLTIDHGEIHTWHVEVEVSDSRTVEFYVALVRHGRDLAQVTFVPSEDAQLDQSDFVDINRRALARLTNLDVG